MKKKKTILFVMPRLPFPATSGRKTSLYHYCRILSEELRCRLVVAAFLEDGDRSDDIPCFIDRLIVLPKPSTGEKIKNIFYYSIIKKSLPLQVSVYLSQKAKCIVKRIMDEENPDIVMGDMVRSIEYIKESKAYTIADLDDRISLRYKRQLKSDIDGINPYGAFLNTVPGFLKVIMLKKGIKLSVVKKEIALLNKYELEAGKVCNATIFVAKKEAESFNTELGEAKAVSVPIGVDTEFFSYRECGSETYNIGFLGALSVAHNENAVKHFVKNIFPYILEKVPNSRFVVIGGGASEELMSLSSENVIFTGRVNDVRKHLEKCKVFVCPMTFGSGIKTKVLEAMSLGLPVVTTSIGAENIDAQDGVDWMVTDVRFSEAVVELLTDDKKRQKMAINGAKFVRDNFSWSVAKEQFGDIISSLNT